MRLSGHSWYFYDVLSFICTTDKDFGMTTRTPNTLKHAKVGGLFKTMPVCMLNQPWQSVRYLKVKMRESKTKFKQSEGEYLDRPMRTVVRKMLAYARMCSRGRGAYPKDATGQADVDDLGSSSPKRMLLWNLSVEPGPSGESCAIFAEEAVTTRPMARGFDGAEI